MQGLKLLELVEGYTGSKIVGVVVIDRCPKILN